MSLASTTTSRSALTRGDGSFEFNRLPTGMYSIRVDGHKGKSADNLRLEPGLTVVVEFVRAAPGVEFPGLTPGQVSEVTGADDENPSPTPSPIPTARPTPRPAPSFGIQSILDILGWEMPTFNPRPWLERVFMGAAAVYTLVLLGILYGTLRPKE
jgi:hypothetical protein